MIRGIPDEQDTGITYYLGQELSEYKFDIEIVDILFLLPVSLSNRIPQIRDFMEFGNIND